MTQSGLFKAMHAEIWFSQMSEPLRGLQRSRTNTRDERSGNSAWHCFSTFGEVGFIYAQMSRTFTLGTLLCFKSSSCLYCNAVWKRTREVLPSPLPLVLPLALTEQLLSQGAGSGDSQKTERFFYTQTPFLYEFTPFGDHINLATVPL